MNDEIYTPEELNAQTASDIVDLLKFDKIDAVNIGTSVLVKGGKDVDLTRAAVEAALKAQYSGKGYTFAFSDTIAPYAFKVKVL